MYRSAPHVHVTLCGYGFEICAEIEEWQEVGIPSHASWKTLSTMTVTSETRFWETVIPSHCDQTAVISMIALLWHGFGNYDHLQLTRTLACETLWTEQLDLGVPGQQSQWIGAKVFCDPFRLMIQALSGHANGMGRERRTKSSHHNSGPTSDLS